MIATSNTYKQLFNSGAIQDYYVEIGGVTYYNDSIYTCTINENLYEKNTFCIGSCCASQIDIVINERDITIKPKDIIKFFYRYTSTNSSSEWIKKFEGTVSSIERTDYGKTSISGVNYLSNDEKYSRMVKSIVTFPTTARFLAKTIAERLGTGLTLYNEEDIIDIELYVQPSDDKLLVDILKDIAVLSCGNWAITQNSLKMVVQDSNVSTVGEYGVGNIDYLGELEHIDGIRLYNNNNEYTAGNDNDYDFVLNFQSDNASQEATDYIYSKLKNYVYKGYRNTRAYIDPAIEIGDYYVMYATENEKQLCVMMSWIFDGSCICNVECPYSEIDNEISKSEQDIENEINNALPFMVYDYNKIKVSSENSKEKYVGMIPINVVRDDVDVDAGFRTNFKVDNDGVLTKRFYRDGIEELFSPVVMDIKSGRHFISDDHAYLKLSKGKHTFIASLQFEGGNIEIEPRKTLYTIEASRIGYKDIAIDGKAIDMAFSGSKLLSKETTFPTEVWFLVKNLTTNIIDVKHFAYNYEDVNNVKIIDDIDYSEDVVNGAIEFGGYWEKSKYYQNKSVFVSDSIPKVALINSTGGLNLYNYNNPVTALFEIETNSVVDVSLIQGWNFKNLFSVDSNMGMIVAYIMSDGHLYYKTIYDIIDPVRYEISFPQATYPLKEIRTFRTNDYRIGFTVVDANDKLWTALTARYYQGDSVESVFLETSFSEDNVSYGFSDFIVPAILDGENLDNENIKLELNYPATGTESNITGIYLRDSKSTPQTYYPVDGKISHEETSNVVEFKAQNTASGGIYSVVQDWGVYEPAKGISDAVAPLYVIVTNSNLQFERGYGGSPPVPFGIDNQTDLLENLLPIGSPFPLPTDQLKEHFLSASCSATISDFNEILNYLAYYKENEVLCGSFDDESISEIFTQLYYTLTVSVYGDFSEVNYPVGSILTGICSYTSVTPSPKLYINIEATSENFETFNVTLRNTPLGQPETEFEYPFNCGDIKPTTGSLNGSLTMIGVTTNGAKYNGVYDKNFLSCTLENEAITISNWTVISEQPV